MAGYQNNMSILLTKIERRLGLVPLAKYLPKEFSKEVWADVIKMDSLDTFSRFYPRKISFKITNETAPKKNGWYYIDEDYIGGQKILGVGDLDWTAFGNRSLGLAQQFGYGLPDVSLANYGMDDISNLIMRGNYASIFSNNVYVEFEYPNRIRLTSVANNEVNLGDFTVILYVKHLDDLSSISPTKMETFEQLAQADVAGFLVNNLKYWDGLETVLASTDLKLGNLENEAAKRDNVIDKLETSYVSAGNDAIPLIISQ